MVIRNGYGTHFDYQPAYTPVLGRYRIFLIHVGSSFHKITFKKILVFVSFSKLYSKAGYQYILFLFFKIISTITNIFLK
jgi:hypothetical protein